MLTRDQCAEIRRFHRSVPCPKCAAEVGKTCTSATGARVQPHYVRWQAAWEAESLRTGVVPPWLRPV